MTAGKPIDEEPPSAPWRKVAALAIGLGALLVLVYFSPLRQYLGRGLEVSQQIRSFGTLAPLVVMAGVAALVAVGFPRLALCGIAGMALGFWSGLFWAQLGTLLGNYALFVVARAGGRDWAQRFLSRRSGLKITIQQRGALGVFLARQIPMPGLVINLACALLPIGHLDFIIGTVIGQLPLAIPFTLMGAGLLQPSLKKSVSLLGLAVVASFLAWFGLRYALRRLRTGTPTDSGNVPPICPYQPPPQSTP